MAGMKTATGDYIDSSWELRVFVGEEDPEAESVTLRVTGESHIGGVLLKIVEEIDHKHTCFLTYRKASGLDRSAATSCGEMSMWTDVTRLPLKSEPRTVMMDSHPRNG